LLEGEVLVPETYGKKRAHKMDTSKKNMALTFTIHDSSINLEKGHDGDAVRILFFDSGSVVLAPGLHGARFSNSTKFDMLKFQKNSEKNS
jgi:hypothetical protein